MEYIANVPVVSKTPSIPSKDAVDPRVVFLLPPASTPEKRSDFQNTLAQSGIHSDLIVNRGIEMRNETVYSFSGMAEELLQLLKHVRSEYT